jgi:predicted RNA-binding Zn ribbon-like protein
MSDTVSDEEFLLALLNTTPLVDGVPRDDLADRASAREWLVDAGGRGTVAELRYVRKVRGMLQAIVRGQQTPEVLASALRDVVICPSISADGINWTLSVAPERELAVRAVLAWDMLTRKSPERLRPCANEQCRLFLIDHSRAGAARWCSMALCGNRMKARRYYRNTQPTRTR